MNTQNVASVQHYRKFNVTFKDDILSSYCTNKSKSCGHREVEKKLVEVTTRRCSHEPAIKASWTIDCFPSVPAAGEDSDSLHYDLTDIIQ